MYDAIYSKPQSSHSGNDLNCAIIDSYNSNINNHGRNYVSKSNPNLKAQPNSANGGIGVSYSNVKIGLVDNAKPVSTTY
jgi:hypothetical protein